MTFHLPSLFRWRGASTLSYGSGEQYHRITNFAFSSTRARSQVQLRSTVLPFLFNVTLRRRSNQYYCKCFFPELQGRAILVCRLINELFVSIKDRLPVQPAKYALDVAVDVENEGGTKWQCSRVVPRDNLQLRL